MANSNVNRLGKDNNGADTEALFLKIFSGEVYSTFATKTVMMDKMVVKPITNAKSAQFPVVGKVGSGIYTPGTEILGSRVDQTEKVITIQNKIITEVFIDEADSRKNHYNIEPEYTKQMGFELAKQLDFSAFITLGNATIAGPNIATEVNNGGYVITNADLVDANITTRGRALFDEIFNAGVILDEKNVPDEGRYCVLAPADYAAVAILPEAISTELRGEGSVATGNIVMLNNIAIIKSTNLPKTNVVTGDNKFDGTNLVGFVFTSDAIGLVKLEDITSESEYDMRRQGTLFISKYVVGFGVLRPECSVQLASA